MRSLPFVGALLCVALVTPTAAPGGIKTCLVGTDSSVLSDRAQIARTRFLANTACVCSAFDGSHSKAHKDYVKCAQTVINAQVSAGSLRKQCQSTVKKYYADSTCGTAPSQQLLPCIRVSAKNSKLSCAIKQGSQCVSKAGQFNQTACPAFSSCIDAADSSGDFVIGAPADSGSCASSDFSQPGLFGIGVRTLSLSRPTTSDGTSLRSLPTEVWYPVASTSSGEQRDALVADRGAPFPLILYFHGGTNSRRTSTFLTQHLASWGYLVVAAEFPIVDLARDYNDFLVGQAGDTHFLIDTFRDYSDDVTSPFFGKVDATAPGITGHSGGGATSLITTLDTTLRDARLVAAAALAPAACSFQREFFGDRSVPLVIVGGTADLFSDYMENHESVFARANAPKILVTLANGTHVGFTDFTFLSQSSPSGNPDDGACNVLHAGNRPVPGDYASLPGLGAGIDPSTCTVPQCAFPANPSAFMEPTRQQRLTKVAVLAFFDAVLRGHEVADIFLKEKLAAENPTDVSVQIND